MCLSSPFMRLFYMTYPLIVVSSVNISMAIRKQRTMYVLPLYGIIIFCMVLILKIYVDLPYIKSGMLIFGELLCRDFVFF